MNRFRQNVKSTNSSGSQSTDTATLILRPDAIKH